MSNRFLEPNLAPLPIWSIICSFIYPTHSTNSLTPNFLSHLTCHSIIGTLKTSIIGLGLVSVRGFSLFPKPPARIAIFIIAICILRLYKMLPAGMHIHLIHYPFVTSWFVNRQFLRHYRWTPSHRQLSLVS